MFTKNINGDYIRGEINSLFKEVNIPISKIQLEPTHMYQDYGQPTSEKRNMLIHFECSEKEFKCLSPLISQHSMRRREILENYVWTSSIDLSLVSKYEMYYECIMILTIVGNSMTFFKKQFRDISEPLRYAIQSNEFDAEVEKFLVHDSGYNGTDGHK